MGQINTLPTLSKKFITFGTITRAIRINDRVIKAWADILAKAWANSKNVNSSKLLINSMKFHRKKL